MNGLTGAVKSDNIQGHIFTYQPIDPINPNPNKGVRVVVTRNGKSVASARITAIGKHSTCGGGRSEAIGTFEAGYSIGQQIYGTSSLRVGGVNLTTAELGRFSVKVCERISSVYYSSLSS